MLRHTTLCLATLLLGAPLLGATAEPARAATPTPLGWCAPADAGPCIASASVVESPGGTSRPVASDDSVWRVSADQFVGGDGAKQTYVSVAPAAGGYLPRTATDDVWTIAIKLGSSMVPRVVDGRGANGTVVRAQVPGGYDVTISGTPVLMTGQGPTGYCDQSVVPWHCDARSSEDEVQFQASIDDFGQWTDASQRGLFYGLDYWTNIEANGLPPQVQESGGISSVIIDLANHNAYADGTTFTGFVHERLPNAMLQGIFGVPDPVAMTGTSLVAGIGGAGAGTVAVAQEPGDQAMLIDMAGVTFPVVTARAGITRARSLVVHRGNLVSRVGSVRTHRVGATTGRLRWAAARNQGAKVTGYQVRCSATGLPAVTGAVSVLHFTSTRFHRARAYSCQVRATWKRGHGRWSKPVRLAARP